MLPPVRLKGMLRPVLLPVPPVRRWQQPTFLPMRSLLLATLTPPSGMLPTLMILQPPAPGEVRCQHHPDL